MKQVVVFEKEYTHSTEDRVVGCWPEKAQQRVDVWLGENGKRQHGAKR